VSTTPEKDVDGEQPKARRWTTARNLTVAALLVLFVIFVFQNSESVQIRILFGTLTMSRALLLIVTFALGAVVGLLVGTRSARQQAAAAKR
jgi:uncharacterized integral membrane protein